MLPWFCSLVTCISYYVHVNALHTLTFNSFPSAGCNHSGISAWRAGQTIDILSLAVTAGGNVCVYTLWACVCRGIRTKGNTYEVVEVKREGWKHEVSVYLRSTPRYPEIASFCWSHRAAHVRGPRPVHPLQGTQKSFWLSGHSEDFCIKCLK